MACAVLAKVAHPRSAPARQVERVRERMGPTIRPRRAQANNSVRWGREALESGGIPSERAASVAFGKEERTCGIATRGGRAQAGGDRLPVGVAQFPASHGIQEED